MRFRDPRILGERVILAPPSAGDRAAFLRVTRASRGLHRPWVQPPTTPGAYDAWLAGGDDGRRERLLVWLRDRDELVGYLAANEIVYAGFQCAYLGYWVAAAAAGRGLMKEALGAAIEHWFTRRRFRLHRLEANIQPDNVRSRALAQSAGFRREGYSPRYLRIDGRWRDHERWALTLEDWRDARRAPSRTR